MAARGSTRQLAAAGLLAGWLVGCAGLAAHCQCCTSLPYIAATAAGAAATPPHPTHPGPHVGALAHIPHMPARPQVLGSLKCDCREQLELSLDYIQANPPGMVVYLQQEGRGIGLANKIAAYALQVCWARGRACLAGCDTALRAAWLLGCDGAAGGPLWRAHCHPWVGLAGCKGPHQDCLPASPFTASLTGSIALPGTHPKPCWPAGEGA